MKKGFTLIENIIVIALIGVLFAGVAGFIQESVNSWIFLTGQKELLMESQGAINRMIREIKATNRNVNITVHASSEVTIRDVYNNSVTFWQDGTALKRNNNVLADNLADPGGLNLRYLDENGNDTTGSNLIQSVLIRLTVVRGQNKIVIESAAALRIKRL